MPKVTAKPLTGPDPKKKSIIADINVVMFASKTVILALRINFFSEYQHVPS